MELAAHGSYKIEQQGNILLVDAKGPFNDVLLAQYHVEMKEVCRKMAGQPWASLVTYYGNGVFTPEAEQSLIAITKYRVKHGMVANASVIIDSHHADLQQMQLTRVYQSADIIFHVFSDVERAKEWLTEFLASPRTAILSRNNATHVQMSI